MEFLEQILLALKRAGLLSSRRGMHGGYGLLKSPEEVTLGQVIRVLDGPLAPIGCVSKTAYQKCRDCPYTDNPRCPVQHVMGAVRDAIADILGSLHTRRFRSRIPSGMITRCSSLESVPAPMCPPAIGGVSV